MDFAEAFKEAVKKLKEAKKKKLLDEFVVIGAIALSRVATVRSTADIDFAVRVDKARAKKLADFLNGESREGDIYDPLAGCIAFTTGKGTGKVNIQLIRFHKGLEDAAFMEATEQTINGQKIPFASWKGLLILKLYAGSPVDLSDAESILKFNSCSGKELQKLEKAVQKLRLSQRLSSLLKRMKTKLRH